MSNFKLKSKHYKSTLKFPTCLTFSLAAPLSRTHRTQRLSPTGEALPVNHINSTTDNNAGKIYEAGLGPLYKFTALLALFLPRQENHHLPPFLGIFSFMMFSTAV